MKKLLTLLLALILTASFAACGTDTPADSTSTAPVQTEAVESMASSEAATTGETIKVSFIVLEYGDYIKLLIDDTAELMQSLGWETDITSADLDLQKEIAAFESCIVNEVDYIVFNDARNREGLEEALSSVREAGIKVINLQPTYYDYCDAVVGCDEAQLGTITGEYIKEKSEELNLDLHMGVMVGMYAIGQQPRADAMYEALGLTKESPEVSIESEGMWAPDTGMALTEDWLQAYPEINTWWFYNDGMLLGAVQALVSAGVNFNEVIVVSIDGLDSLQLIKEGTCSATGARDRAGEATKIIEVLEVWQAGEELPELDVMVPGILITAENVDEYL